MPKKILDDGMKARMAELREERGWSYMRIARTVGVSKSTVRWFCLVNGVEKPGINPAPPRTSRGPAIQHRNGYIVRRFTPEEDARLKRLEALSGNYAEIGRQLGRARNSIVGRLATLARHDARAEDQP